MTINVTPFTPVVIPVNNNQTSLDLFNFFDDPFTTGKVANFKLRETDIGTGEINVLLYDQQGQGAPITVNNFVNYVEDGDYVNTIIHRSIKNFVIQGGGFVVNNLKVSPVPTDAPIPNEFSTNRSNTRGTIAMAKLPEQPNSATSQWFFNLQDNSSNLDNQNGGFTVFGKVLSGDDLSTVDQIAALPIFNASNLNPNFNTIPVNTFNFDVDNPRLDQDDDFVRFESITVSDNPELAFSIKSNTNPTLVNARIDDEGNLSLNSNILNAPFYRFQNTAKPGTYLFAGEAEKQSILKDFPSFQLEGFAFDVGTSRNNPSGNQAQIGVEATNLLGESISSTLNVTVTGNNNQGRDELIAFNRFQNKSVPGTYLYAGEAESANIERNFPNFVKEGVAFYAFGADANRGVDFYRFQNTAQPGTYIFVGEDEKNSILANFPEFKLEGVAFEVGI